MAYLKYNMSEKLKRLLQLSAKKGVFNRLTLANYNPVIFLNPSPLPPRQALKTLASLPRHKKALIIPICSTCLTITHTDFITACKHVLFPSYVIQVI